MAHKTIYKVKSKRRRQGITNKEKRLGLLRSGKPRMVVRVNANKVTCQIVDYVPKGDVTKVNTTSLELKNYGYKGHNGNAAAAYLTGYLCGKKAAAKNVKEAVLDIGLRTPVLGSNAFAALKGAVDAGLDIPLEETAFPKEEHYMKETVKETKETMDKGIKQKEKKTVKAKK